MCTDSALKVCSHQHHVLNSASTICFIFTIKVQKPVLLGRPEVGEGLCDKVPQALVFTKQSIVGSGCRAKTSQRIYFACTEAKSAKPSYLKKKW